MRDILAALVFSPSVEDIVGEYGGKRERDGGGRARGGGGGGGGGGAGGGGGGGRGGGCVGRVEGGDG
jgi:hypothetical protein